MTDRAKLAAELLIPAPRTITQEALLQLTEEALRLLNPPSGPSRKKIITLARLAAGPPPHLRSHDRPSPHAEAVVAMALKEQEP